MLNCTNGIEKLVWIYVHFSPAIASRWRKLSVKGRWKYQAGSREQQTSHSQLFLFYCFVLFLMMVICERPLVLPLALSRNLTPRLSMTSKITTRKSYVKIRMTSTHKRTLTERHTEYNKTNTLCRSCYIRPPPPPPLPAQSPPPGELINSDISQRLPRVELTNHLSRAFPIPLLNDYQRPH